MQRVVIDEPYEFVPPVYSEWWPTMLRFILRRYIRKPYGVHSIECRQRRTAEGIARGRAQHHARAEPLPHGRPDGARRAGHGGRLPPVRDGELARVQAEPVSNVHDAADGRVQRAARRQRPAGDRDGDRHPGLAAAAADRVSRRRDHAAQRSHRRDDGRAVVHRAAGGEAAEEGRQAGRRGDSSRRHALCVSTATWRQRSGRSSMRWKQLLSWQPQRHLSIVERIDKIGQALLSLKEIEFLGAPGSGNIYERAEKLVEEVLAQLETNGRSAIRPATPMMRVKRLRTAILPDMVDGQGDARGARAALARFGGGVLRAADFALSAGLHSAREESAGAGGRNGRAAARRFHRPVMPFTSRFMR